MPWWCWQASGDFGKHQLLLYFVPVLFQIFHKWCAAGSNICVVAAVAFSLLVDVGCGILQMTGSELRQLADAFIVQMLQMIVPARGDKGPQIAPLPDDVDEGAMRRWTIFMKFIQISPKGV